MKKILITAYAVNPYKGSEDAMGWNMIMQAGRYQEVIVVTRKNNRGAIEQYITEHKELNIIFSRLSFLFFDWPEWTIRWKKGPVLSMLYYYGWQLTVALWLKWKKYDADIVHNLNFHNDWTPSFLWILGKPMVWGHVGHHPKTPKVYLLPVYGKAAYYKDRALWILKNIFWYFDPFLYLCKTKADMIICMNSEAVKHLRLKENFIIHPSVAAEQEQASLFEKNNRSFHVISVGRFVPLKGFDLTIRSFAEFYKHLTLSDRKKAKLTLIGTGPLKKMLQDLVIAEKIGQVVTFVEWLPRENLKEIYASASVFLFPSHEGAGMVIPEAMSYGLPVVCLQNCGPGELVPPLSKLIVPYGDYSDTVQRLAGHLASLMVDPTFMASERELVNRRYESLLNWNIRGEMLKDVYSKVLNIKTVNLKTYSNEYT
ncbi:glycosyltransferase family 4 protein [Pedobacter cryoconitis]|uniref:glycosyltransferase family 4 protein n=1 Tax=Pedobacter cryoconitis TaxID=188932 RepID=UPI00160EEFFC|nr:glycosyltransferase family 4 protein [Pedobacter cryoconitis]MBB5647180.1 glycosyltransferase involved in cell wall biosynthesis [Pedobacter cryoconitis]